MARLILIESSTNLCSTAICEDNKLLSYREHEKDHASLTAEFIRQMLEEQNLTVKDCDAVCVSMGPGSYTGLRVGVSTAKGLCFGAKLPLIAVSSIETLAYQALNEKEKWSQAEYIIPIIDARRMEVYTAIFNKKFERLTEIEAKIIDENSFIKEREEAKCLFAGNAVNKCEAVLSGTNSLFMQCEPKASSLIEAALRKFENREFEDLAYFEPLYLKDFVASSPKKKLF